MHTVCRHDMPLDHKKPAIQTGVPPRCGSVAMNQGQRRRVSGGGSGFGVQGSGVGVRRFPEPRPPTPDP